MERLPLALTGLAAVSGFMVLVWVGSVVRRDVALVDRAWGVSFVLLAWVYVALSEAMTPRSWLAAVLVTIWGLRLSGYITWRNWGQGEDWRWGSLHDRLPGNFALTSLVVVFLGHALSAWSMGIPLLATVRVNQPQSLTWLDGLGVVVWLVGFLFEAVGDWQLARFRARPDSAGRVLDTGLWRHTRHPNYFGDAVMWWGLGLLAVASGAWWTLAGPAGMTLVLLRFTGVFSTERHLRQSRGDAYAEYVARTSAFVPLPRKPLVRAATPAVHDPRPLEPAGRAS